MFLFLVVISSMLLSALLSSLRTNMSHILVSHAYSEKYTAEESIRLLRSALLIVCKESVMQDCESATDQSDEAIVEIADKYFMQNLEPILVITDSAKIPNHQFTQISALSSLPINQTPGVLFGHGYFQSRIFITSDRESCWEIGVKAKHDDPAPVNLQIWMDETAVGNLSYGKGDQSWEVLSVYSSIKPGASWFRIWFINDYINEEMSADRNAYMEYVTLSRVESVYCESS